jgi:hypothetical protein
MLTPRPIELLQLPLSPKAEIMHPEMSILVFPGATSFDAGAFCYLTRSAIVRSRRLSRARSERWVDTTSFRESRQPPIRRFIRYLSDLLTSGGKRPITVKQSAREYGCFLTWAEANGHLDAIDDKEVTRQAFRQYVEHLRELVNTDQLSMKTAAGTQYKILGVLSDLTNIDDFHHGVNLFRARITAIGSTRPPPEGDQARVLALCGALFQGLSALGLRNAAYPYPLPVPQFLGAANDTLWVFPGTRWCMPPHVLAVRESLARGCWAYDYENGRIANAVEVARYFQGRDEKERIRQARHAVDLATSLIIAANRDPQQIHRRNAALSAHNAFIVLFLAQTGMNWASVRELPWNEAFESGMERQGFRTIKYRAGGKMVSFEIQSVFFPTFKRYLELRAYLLNGISYDRLFMACHHHGKRITPLDGQALTPIFNSLRGIYPSVPAIKSKAWRAGKSDWLLRNTDPATTALILQNTLPTVLRYYAEGSPTAQEDELGRFFDRLRGVVIAQGERTANTVERAIGVCTSFGSPHQSIDAPIPSDCRRAEGCLFCDHFRIHADQRDTRKLLSCRYCIEQTAHLADSEEQFNRLFGPIFERIKVLLGEIECRQPGIVAPIEREIEAGELDPFWARKMELLVDLELTV